jgi:two-component system chemotaxis response regulator CheB
MDALLNAYRRNIVVIGASAGGVDALRALFAMLPADASASYFVVLHLSAQYDSQLDRILQSATTMPVTFASDGQPIMPDTVYLAPPDRHLMVGRDGIRVTRGPKESRARPAIDVLFRSAALAFGRRVLGLVMSGSLDDGTAGLWQIKDRKGLAFVQDPEEAQHRSMPDSAIEHVDVDYVGTVEALAVQIAQAVAAELPRLAAEPLKPGLRLENAIALGERDMDASVMDLGKPSRYTCSECGGVLAQIEEGRVIRFRCHTGHAYSFQALLAEVNGTVDANLWATIRAIEERIFILQHQATLAEQAGRHDDAARLRRKADQAEQKCRPLRELVLDTDFFASD